MRVDSKNKDTPVEYLIRYTHYSDTNPYDLIDAKNFDLNYDKSSSGIMIKFHQIKLVEDSPKSFRINSVTYKAYAADSRFNLKR